MDPGTCDACRRRTVGLGPALHRGHRQALPQQSSGGLAAGVRTRRFFNSQVRQAAQRRFGYDAFVGQDGNYHGRGAASHIRSIMVDVIVQEPMKSLAHAFRKEMEVWASKGVTTWSSSLSGLVNLNVYAQLDRNGEMPMRFAYSHRMGDTNFPYSVGFYERLGDVAGHGTPHL